MAACEKRLEFRTGLKMNPSATDDNDAGGDERVILILIMIETAH